MITRVDPVDASQAEGLYYSSRTTRNGIGKMYTYMGIAPYTTDSLGNLQSSLFGLATVESEQIAPNTFIIIQQIGDVALSSISRFADEDGMKKLTSPYGVSIEADLDVWLMLLALAWFLLAVLWNAVFLLGSLLQVLLRKMKGKSVGNGPFGKQKCASSFDDSRPFH